MFCVRVCTQGAQSQQLESDRGLEELSVRGASVWSECRGVITSEDPARLASGAGAGRVCVCVCVCQSVSAT